jgi:hypothetical protein
MGYTTRPREKRRKPQRYRSESSEANHGSQHWRRPADDDSTTMDDIAESVSPNGSERSPARYTAQPWFENVMVRDEKLEGSSLPASHFHRSTITDCEARAHVRSPTVNCAEQQRAHGSPTVNRLEQPSAQVSPTVTMSLFHHADTEEPLFELGLDMSDSDLDLSSYSRPDETHPAAPSNTPGYTSLCSSAAAHNQARSFNNFRAPGETALERDLNRKASLIAYPKLPLESTSDKNRSMLRYKSPEPEAVEVMSPKAHPAFPAVMTLEPGLRHEKAAERTKRERAAAAEMETGEEDDENIASTIETSPVPKRGRGRPPNRPKQAPVVSTERARKRAGSELDEGLAVKKSKGRPPKDRSGGESDRDVVDVLVAKPQTNGYVCPTSAVGSTQTNEYAVAAPQTKGYAQTTPVPVSNRLPIPTLREIRLPVPQTAAIPIPDGFVSLDSAADATYYLNTRNRYAAMQNGSSTENGLNGEGKSVQRGGGAMIHFPSRFDGDV